MYRLPPRGGSSSSRLPVERLRAPPLRALVFVDRPSDFLVAVGTEASRKMFQRVIARCDPLKALVHLVFESFGELAPHICGPLVRAEAL